jgi:hypothetical protein
MKTPTCPDCEVAMKEGWIPDANYLFTVQPNWREGTPRGKGGRRQVPVQAFRCPDCGYLRLYAFPKKWNKVD